jgi:hypothetical protein
MLLDPTYAGFKAEVIERGHGPNGNFCEVRARSAPLRERWTSSSTRRQDPQLTQSKKTLKDVTCPMRLLSQAQKSHLAK